MNKLIFLVLQTAAVAANAESVGHFDVDLGAPWIPLTSFETKLVIDNGVATVPIPNRVYYIAGPDGVPKAVLTITASDGKRAGNHRWVSDTCGVSRNRFLAQDFDTNKLTTTRECLVVNGSFAPERSLQADSEIAKAIHDKGLGLFKSGYLIRSFYGGNGGSVGKVTLMTDKSFVGLASVTPETADLHDVPQNLVAWGEALQHAVKSAALAMGGKLELPPIQFSR